MDSEDALDQLLEAKILHEESNEFELSRGFLECLEQKQNEPDIEQPFQNASDPQGHEATEEEGRPRYVFGQKPELHAIYQVVRDATDTLSFGERVNTVAIIEQFLNGFPPAEGAPSSFTPLYAAQLEYLTKIYPRAIVYIWRNNCDPCEVMQAEFDELFKTHPDDLGLFAVFGPEDAETLAEEYDAVAAPTTLFLINGDVDCRLLGAHHRTAIEAEIDKLRNS